VRADAFDTSRETLGGVAQLGAHPKEKGMAADSPLTLRGLFPVDAPIPHGMLFLAPMKGLPDENIPRVASLDPLPV